MTAIYSIWIELPGGPGSPRSPGIPVRKKQTI